MQKTSQSETPTGPNAESSMGDVVTPTRHSAPTVPPPPSVTRQTDKVARANDVPPRSVGPVPHLHSRSSSRTIVAVTDRHLPLVVSTLRGDLDLEAVHRHDRQVNDIIQEQLARGCPIVYVVDARGLSMPSAMVRRYWADRVNESRAVLEAMLGTFIVVDNPFLRGALTAIAWMTDAARTLSYAPSLEDAVHRANSTLIERGLSPVAFHPATHSVPPRP